MVKGFLMESMQRLWTLLKKMVGKTPRPKQNLSAARAPDQKKRSEHVTEEEVRKRLEGLGYLE